MNIYTDFSLIDNLTGDLLIQNGDFIISETSNREIYDIINDFPGYWKQYLNVGVGLPSYVGSPNSTYQLSQSIINQLQNDGFTLTNPKVSFDLNTSTFQIIPNAIRK